MYIKTRYCIAVLVIFSLLIVSEDSDGAVAAMSCWSGQVPSGGIGPDPTLGCTLAWEPGGTADMALFTVGFTCSREDCVVTEGPEPIQPVLLNSPVVGSKSEYIDSNCYGEPVGATAAGIASILEWDFSGGNIDIVEIDNIVDASYTLVADFCLTSGTNELDHAGSAQVSWNSIPVWAFGYCHNCGCTEWEVSHSATNADSYTVEQSASSNGPWTVYSTTSAGISYPHNGTAGRWYRVKASNAAGFIYGSAIFKTGTLCNSCGGGGEEP